jgi:DNA helicase HerA-like ATPase
MRPFRWPHTDEHVAILGGTGTGTTTFASHVLSVAPFDRMPYVAIDMKGDELLSQINLLREIGLHEKIPSQPGLFVIRPIPSDQDGIEAWLYKLWRQENTGLYVDEAYLLPDKNWTQNILAQGRSKRIPGIFSSQRPVNVPRSVFSESSHIVAFRLNDRRDIATVGEFTPRGMMDARLPDFHSRWYSPKWDESTDKSPGYVLKPVPPAENIIERINARLKPIYKIG